MLVETKRIPVKEVIFIGLLPEFVKKIIYKCKGYNIGKGVKIGFGSVIISRHVTIKEYSEIGLFSAIIADSVEIGRFSKIGGFTYINCVKLILGDDSKIREQVYVGGTLNPDSELIIGDRCSIGQSSYINPARRILIGDDTAIGGSGFIFTHGSWQSILDGYPVIYEPVTIESNVYIAWRVFIHPGITIGENSTIAADSSVTISVPPNSLASGSPLRIALSGSNKWPRTLSSYTKIKIIEDINDHFSDYLNHHGFRVVLERTDKYDVLNLIQRKNSIYFYKIEPDEVTLIENNTYLFLKDTLYNTIKNQNIMILNIGKHMRTGSNELGEEYVRYLSRYGIRFSRI